MFQPKREMLAKIYCALEAEGDEKYRRRSRGDPRQARISPTRRCSSTGPRARVLTANKMKDPSTLPAWSARSTRAEADGEAYGIQRLVPTIIDGKYTTVSGTMG